MGMFLRRGKPIRMLNVNINGNFDESSAYVTIGGLKYTAATMLILKKGTVISIYVGGTAFGSLVPSVNLNGTTVYTGPGTYEYTLEANSTLNFVKKDAVFFSCYSCDITTT